MKQGIRIIVFAAAILCLFSCSAEEAYKEADKIDIPMENFTGCSNYYLIDQFDRSNTTGDKKTTNIVKVTLDGELRECIFEHPLQTKEKDQSITFKGISLCNGAKIEFKIAVGSAAYDGMQNGKHLGGIEYRIYIDDGKKSDLVFEHTLCPFEKEEDRGWHGFSLDISKYAGRAVDIVFTTRYAPGGLVYGHALWAEPTIVNIPTDEEYPNIILISIDTLRADHLGCYGYDRETSPNIDRFARESMLYKYNFSSAPITLESHASIMTSLNPNKHLAGGRKLDNEFVTMAEILSKMGYYTFSYNGGVLVGKKTGLDQGFDEYQSFDNSLREDDAYWEFIKTVNHIRTKQFGENNKKFFLFFHTYVVHDRYNPPAGYNHLFVKGESEDLGNIPELVKEGCITEYKREYEEENGDTNFPREQREYFVSLYDAEIRYTDAWIGRFFEFLKDEGLYDNSLIIILADHGEQFYEHGGWKHGTLYGTELYVPLIIKYPYSKKRGVEKERIARNIDVLPTILYDFLNIHIVDSPFDGIPLSQPLGDRLSLGFRMNNKKQEMVGISILRDDTKFIFSIPDNTCEAYRFKDDILDMKEITVDEATLSEVTAIVSNEYKIFQENVNKRKNAAETNNQFDEETKNKLKDLGYLQ
jgi:arylsulfatase A-like enzyme